MQLNQEEAEKNKWADVPAWKRAVMEKKETERLFINAVYILISHY